MMVASRSTSVSPVLFFNDVRSRVNRSPSGSERVYSAQSNAPSYQNVDRHHAANLARNDDTPMSTTRGHPERRPSYNDRHSVYSRQSSIRMLPTRSSDSSSIATTHGDRYDAYSSFELDHRSRSTYSNDSSYASSAYREQPPPPQPSARKAASPPRRRTGHSYSRSSPDLSASQHHSMPRPPPPPSYATQQSFDHSAISSQIRLTAKFPLPRTKTIRSSRGSEVDQGLMPAQWTDRTDKGTVRHIVASKIAAQEAAEMKARWTKAKWLLLLSVLVLFAYGVGGLMVALLTWFRTWARADVLLVAEDYLLIYITLASSMCMITALLGLTGTMLNSRPILAFYNLLLWPTLAAILVVGYTSYKKQALNLDRKLNQAWSEFFDDVARLRIQNTLHCCGYYDPLHEATFSKRCYPRTSLPGCKGKLFRFEKEALRQVATAAFAIVPVHIFNIFVGLLCSNQVNRSFGKGLMPRQYRLSMVDVRENAISVLRNLPAMPDQAAKGGRANRQLERQPSYGSSIGSSITDSSASMRRRSRRNSISTLASMPVGNPLRNLKGLGLGVGTVHEIRLGDPRR